jgi:hypothetical protein
MHKLLRLLRLLFSKELYLMILWGSYKTISVLLKNLFSHIISQRKNPKFLFFLFLSNIRSFNNLVLWGIHTYCKSRGWLPKKSLKGEHVFLTGAGSGLGRYMAIEFAKQGCKLSLSDISMDGLEETSKILNIIGLIERRIGLDAEVVLIICDVSNLI